MAPKRRIQFPAAEPNYRKERLNAAIACQNYNDQREDAPAEERIALWLGIVNANKSTGELDLAQSEASVDGAATSPASAQPARAGLAPEPLPVASAAAVGQSFDTVPRPGSLPAIRADSSLENGDTKPPSNSKDAPASPASLEESLSTTSTLSPKQQKPAVFFPGAGVAPYIKPPVRIDYGTQLDIAPSTFVNRNLVILDTPVSSVRIGEDCLIGPNLSIYAVEHPIDPHERCGPTGAASFGLDVTIEDQVWIGGGVTVLGGVTIGKGSAIGAASLVTKDIPAYSLAYGHPARVIKRIGDDAREYIEPNETSMVWKIPDSFCSVVYGRVRFGKHEFVRLEMVTVLLFLGCVLLLVL